MEMSFEGITDQHSAKDAFTCMLTTLSSNIFHLFVHVSLCDPLELIMHHGPLQQVELLAQDHHHW